MYAIHVRDQFCITLKYHKNILKGIQDIDRTRNHSLNIKGKDFQIRKQQFSFLYETHCHDQGPRLQSFLEVKVTLTLRCEFSKVLFYTFYAPNFKEVERAYWFGLVRPSVRLSVRNTFWQLRNSRTPNARILKFYIWHINEK